MDKKLDRMYIHQLLQTLIKLHDHAKKDCPSEYRTKHFRWALEDAYNLIVELTLVYGANRERKEQSNEV